MSAAPLGPGRALQNSEAEFIARAVFALNGDVRPWIVARAMGLVRDTLDGLNVVSPAKAAAIRALHEPWRTTAGGTPR